MTIKLRLDVHDKLRQISKQQREREWKDKWNDKRNESSVVQLAEDAGVVWEKLDKDEEEGLPFPYGDAPAPRQD